MNTRKGIEHWWQRLEIASPDVERVAKTGITHPNDGILIQLCLELICAELKLRRQNHTQEQGAYN